MAEEKKKQKYIEVDQFPVDYYKNPEMLKFLTEADQDLVCGLWPIDPMVERWPMGRKKGPDGNWLDSDKFEKAREIGYNTFELNSPKSDIVRSSVRTERMKLDIFQKMINGDSAMKEKRDLMIFHAEYGSRAYYNHFGMPFEDWPPTREMANKYIENVKNASDATVNAAFEMAIAPYKKKWGLAEGKPPTQAQLDEANTWLKEFEKQVREAIIGRPPDFSN